MVQNMQIFLHPVKSKLSKIPVNHYDFIIIIIATSINN